MKACTIFAAGAALAASVSAAPSKKHDHKMGPFVFTSTYTVRSVPEEVVDGEGEFTGGLAGSESIWHFGFNSDTDVICYNITSTGFKGEYESPALTATHIHEGAKGEQGPPRVVFPDPEGEGDLKTAFGCIQGPFETGVTNDDDIDQGEGFTVKQIEEDPSMFYVDIHSSEAVPGANRGQFSKKKDGCY